MWSGLVCGLAWPGPVWPGVFALHFPSGQARVGGAAAMSSSSSLAVAAAAALQLLLLLFVACAEGGATPSPLGLAYPSSSSLPSSTVSAFMPEQYDGELARTFAEYASAGFTVAAVVSAQQGALRAYVGEWSVPGQAPIVVVAFKGTQYNSLRTWIKNLDFLELDYGYPGVEGAKVHSGFFTSYNFTDLRPGVVSAVTSLQGNNNHGNGVNNHNNYIRTRVEANNGQKCIVVVGHSLGGAFAAFCALDLKLNFGYENVKMVTFGQPRIGNRKFSEFFNSQIPNAMRMTHQSDPVPHLPPLLGKGYRHFPTEAR
eukprot:jgi/Chlat1/6233/Chrsp44S05763